MSFCFYEQQYEGEQIVLLGELFLRAPQIFLMVSSFEPTYLVTQSCMGPFLWDTQAYNYYPEPEAFAW